MTAFARTLVGIYPDNPALVVGPAKDQPIEIVAGESIRIPYQVYRADGSTPRDYTGSALILTIRALATTPPSSTAPPPLSLQATPDAPASGTSHFDLAVANTTGWPPDQYRFDVIEKLANGDEVWEIIDQRITVRAAARITTDPVTVNPTQAPLAQGPAGPAGAAGPPGPADVIVNDLRATDVIAIKARNTTPATAPIPVQRSPMIMLGGSGWDTGATVSRQGEWYTEARMVSGSPVVPELHFLSRVDPASSPTSVVKLDSSGNLTFELDVTITIGRTANATSGNDGQLTQIIGQQGNGTGRGGNFIIAAGANGTTGVGNAGDIMVQGGGPKPDGSHGGDVILRPDPLVNDSNSGIDVGFASNCQGILLGHVPANASDQTGQVAFLGQISTDMVVANSVPGWTLRQYAATNSGAGQTMNYSSQPGGDGQSGLAGGGGGVARLLGPIGGAGTATQNPGNGGDAIVRAGDAGTVNGHGGAFGGSVRLQPGAGSGGFSGGVIEIGYTGTPVPLYIGIGQATSPLGFFGNTARVIDATTYTLHAGSVSHDLPAGATLAQVEAALRQVIKTLGHTSGNGLWKADM